MRLFSSLLGLVILGGVAYLILTDRVGFSSEYEEEGEKKSPVHDYGVLEMPVNHLHKGVGRAAGQVDTEYGAPESMTVESLGQNYNGRAFGL